MRCKTKNTGLIGGIEKRNIEIVDYNPEWKDKFQAHKEIISKALGKKALRIEHIGSTSVPGLAAKPIIDILLVVADSGKESFYLPQMEKAGYKLRVREPDFYEHRMFRTPQKDVHIHVFSLDSPEIDRYLIFRNYLRQNAKTRQQYEKTKRRLAAKPWSDMNAYAKAKTKLIEKIISEAGKSV